MSTRGDYRMSPLERHCRLLLRAYPVAYRGERGEEIIGTLLEATPQGRCWPLRRDVRGLVAGGLRARVALNGRNATAANLRVAALVGVTAYLAYVVAGVAGAVLFRAEYGILDVFRRTSPSPFGWPVLVVATLVVVTLVLAWLSRRRAIVLAGALPAVAVLAVVSPWRPYGYELPATELACLAVLAALAGRERPGRRWLWLIGPIVLAGLLMARVLPGTSMEAVDVLLPYLLLTLAIIGLAWLAIDARLAIAIDVFLLAGCLPVAMADLASGSGPWPILVFPGSCVAAAAPAVWLLHRQCAGAGQAPRS